MSDIRIKDMAASTNLQDSDNFVIDNSEGTRNTTLLAIANAILEKLQTRATYNFSFAQDYSFPGAINSVAERVGTLESGVSTLESDTSTLESDVSTLESSVSTLESKVTTLESKVSTLEDEMAELYSDGDVTEGLITGIFS